MGLIKAGMGALGGTLADQWKEFFYCDSLDKDVLMVKGQKRTSRRSSNNGEDNIITNGSGIAVADGQCMLIVEQGRVVEVCAEPGESSRSWSSASASGTGGRSAMPTSHGSIWTTSSGSTIMRPACSAAGCPRPRNGS